MLLKSLIICISFLVVTIHGQTYNEFVLNLNAVSPATGSSAKATVTEAMGAYRLKVIAPVHSFIQAQCSITTKTGQVFYLSRSGEIDLTKDAMRYAGSGTLPLILSIGNEMVVAGFTFTCTFTAVAADNSNCDCGWKKASRIVGGTYTTANEFVSHVGLVQVNTNSLDLFCGGTIITQKHVVSAAHCFGAYTSPTNLYIFAGYQDYTKSPSTDTPWSSQYAIAGWKNHPSFNPNTGVNDIAIVQVTNYIRFTLGVGPGCIPFTYRDYNFENKMITAVGWGTIGYGEDLSNILKKVSLNITSNAYCSTKIQNIVPQNICTFTRGSDSCQHDSGGGLYYDANQSTKFFIAVINYGIGCAGNYPSVNTRVDANFGFIAENTLGINLCRK